MSSRALRRLRYDHTGSLRTGALRSGVLRTGNLRRPPTRALDDGATLRDSEERARLQAQVDKLLTETKLLSARLSAISDVAVAVNSSLRLNEILEVAVKKVRHALGFDYCGVGMLSEDGKRQTLRPLLWPDKQAPAPAPQTYCAEEGITGAVMSSGKPVVVRDLTERPLRIWPARLLAHLHPEIGARFSSAGLRSLMVLPLRANGRTLGCLLFGKHEEDCYNQDDLQVAYLIGMLVATAIHNSRLFSAETRRSQQLQLLNEIGQTATSILDPTALIMRVPPLVQTWFRYDVIKIGMLEGDAIIYAPDAQFISSDSEPREMRISVSVGGRPVGVVGLAVYTGQMVHLPDVLADERWSDVTDTLTGPNIRSVLVIPMTARDKVLGVLHFESAQVDAFSAADITILRSLANQVGIALDNARLYQQLNELFHGYIAPQVASTLLEDPTHSQLGGQRRELTVLFADIDGFTSLSEQVPAEELLDLLNACLGVATEAIQEYEGTVDKYMGDALMALFNAPHSQPDHAWRAMQAAVEMQRKLRKLTASWQRKLVFSIGLNTGEAVVGNIGSASLRNYTAIGDTVNLAKRIQEAAAPGQVLVSQATYQAALQTAEGRGISESDDNIVTYRVGTAPIRGRTRPAVLYEVHPFAKPPQPQAKNLFPVTDQQ